jgi:predicted nucleic acid-binding protein
VVDHALADTSVFIARESGRPLDSMKLPEQLAVSVITIGELEAGVLIAGDLTSRARRLATLGAARALLPLPVDESVASAWAKLRAELRQRGQRLPLNDSWIAATAIAHSIPVVTQDDDYEGIAGLDVIKV